MTLLRLLADPGSWWITQAGGREALLRRCLAEAVAWLRSELGPDPAGWQWGRLHRITFPHALGVQKPLDQVFNRGPVPIGGDTDTPLQAANLPGPSYENNAWTPSMRHIIDLGDLAGSQAVFPIGQSGQLGSPHYDDLAGLWSRGEYHPMLWTREPGGGARGGEADTGAGAGLSAGREHHEVPSSRHPDRRPAGRRNLSRGVQDVRLRLQDQCVWHRVDAFEPGCPLPALVQAVPHVGFRSTTGRRPSRGKIS